LGVNDVAGYLGAEILQGREPFFIAEFFDERDFQFLAIEVAGKIEQVCFDTELGRRIVEGGTQADVEDGAESD
jgi:hypothetical protein